MQYAPVQGGSSTSNLLELYVERYIYKLLLHMFGVVQLYQTFPTTSPWGYNVCRMQYAPVGKGLVQSNYPEHV